MTNRKCKIGNKAKAARRLAAILMSATLTGAIAASSPAIMQVSASTFGQNADYIFEVLTQKLGYSEAAACGIMANIRCESTFNPHAWNAGGGSYGLCQWTGGRYGRLRSWCGSNGYDYSTIDGQLAYLQYELQSHYRGVEDYLRSVENTSDGAYKAGQYYCYHFEAPASRGSVSGYRGGLASGSFWSAYRPAEWYFEDGVWRYIKSDGTYHTSWLTIDNKTYYLDENGNRVSGWKTIKGDRYYFDKDGVMVTGWTKIDGKDYLFDEDGPLVTGLVLGGESWYMLDETGSLQASAEMDDFADNWESSIKPDESTALADAEEADSKETASADQATETASTAAGGKQQFSLVASAAPSAEQETSEDQQASAASKIVGLTDTENSSAATLPSVTTAAIDVDPEEAAAAAADEDNEEALDSEETSAAANTAATADSEEEDAKKADTEEEAEEEKAVEADTEEEAEEEKSEEADTEEETEEQESAEADTEEETEEQESAEADTEEETEEQESAEADTEEEAEEQKITEASESDQDTDSEDAGQGADTTDTEEITEDDADDYADASDDNEISGIGFSEDILKRQSTEGNTTGLLGILPDEFAAADALRTAAEAQDETTEEESSEGFFMIYDPTAESEDSDASSTIAGILPQTDAAETAETEEKTETAAAETTVNTPSVEEAVSIKITLGDGVIFLAEEDMDDIVKILDEKDMLNAVTSDGEDITDKVTADYERISPRGNAYKVTFTASYKGKTAEFETTAYVNN